MVQRRTTQLRPRSARLDDAVEILTECGELRGASLHMLQEARLGEDTLVRAALLIACMDEGGRPMRLPAPVRAALAQVAGTESPRSRHIRI